MRTLLLAITMVVASSAYAEINVSAKKVFTVQKSTPTIVTQVETEDGDPFGDPVVSEGETVVSSKKSAVILIVGTDSGDVNKALIKLKCRTAKIRRMGQTTFFIDKPGTHEVDVNVITTNPANWEDKLIKVTVSGVAPDPDNPDNPDTPDEKAFDGLARKVNALAQALGPDIRNQMVVVLSSAADKMQRFDYKTTTQAKEYIKQNWPRCNEPNCQKIWDLLAQDSSRRNLGWQETQLYYRTVALGVR